MAKNRTMAVKNAKVVQFGIKSSKDAMCADILNARKVGVETNGLSLYARHAKAMTERNNKNAKWRAKA